MYGLLIEGFRHYVEATYGLNMWTTIMNEVMIKPKDFQSHQVYKESLLNEFILVLSNVSTKSVSTIYYETGYFFLKFLKNKGFNSLLLVTGRTFVDFVINLDNMHLQLKQYYPLICSPSFTILKIDRQYLYLIYATKRTGYTDYVRGQLVAVANLLYNINIKVKFIEQKQNEYYFENLLKITNLDGIFMKKDNLEEIKYLCKSKQILDSHISAKDFHNFIPFYLIIDHDMILKQVGLGFLKINPNLKNQKFTDVIELYHPLIFPTYDEVTYLIVILLLLLLLLF